MDNKEKLVKAITQAIFDSNALSVSPQTLSDLESTDPNSTKHTSAELLVEAIDLTLRKVAEKQVPPVSQIGKATKDSLGLVMIGDGLDITVDGKLSVVTVPPDMDEILATTDTKYVAKTGDTMSGVLTVSEPKDTSDGFNIVKTDKNNVVRKAQYGINEYGTYIISDKNDAQANYISLGDSNTSLLKPLTLGSGGTGSNSAAGARTNLGAMGAQNTNGYWGLVYPNGTNNNYIRTPTVGLIPYAASNNSYLGTSGWRFKGVYCDNYYYGTQRVNDFVVATGRSGNQNAAHGSVAGTFCHWVKFNSGFCIIAAGISAKRSSDMQHLIFKFPFALKEFPVIAVSGSATGRTESNARYSNSITTECDIWINSGGGNFVKGNFVIIGKWK